MTPRYIDAEKLLADNREFIHPKFQTTLRDIVNEQPTADVANVVHAHWIGVIHDKLSGCSNCSSYVEEEIDRVRAYFHFCPTCGAKMDEEE